MLLTEALIIQRVRDLVGDPETDPAQGGPRYDDTEIGAALTAALGWLSAQSKVQLRYRTEDEQVTSPYALPDDAVTILRVQRGNVTASENPTRFDATFSLYRPTVLDPVYKRIGQALHLKPAPNATVPMRVEYVPALTTDVLRPQEVEAAVYLTAATLYDSSDLDELRALGVNFRRQAAVLVGGEVPRARRTRQINPAEVTTGGADTGGSEA